MKKFFTILSTKAEVKNVKKILKKFNIKRYDITKVFDVYGYKIVNFALVCDEDTFTSITKAMNGERLY